MDIIKQLNKKGYIKGAKVVPFGNSCVVKITSALSIGLDNAVICKAKHIKGAFKDENVEDYHLTNIEQKLTVKLAK